MPLEAPGGSRDTQFGNTGTIQYNIGKGTFGMFIKKLVATAALAVMFVGSQAGA